MAVVIARNGVIVLAEGYGTLGAAVLCSAVCRGAESSANRAGGTLLQHSGLPDGICVVIGCSDADLAISLAEHDGFVIHALFQNDDAVEQARAAIAAEGLYGRVAAGRADWKRLPYVDNLINVAVVEGDGENGPLLEEIKRVLAPLGVAFFRGRSDGLRAELRRELFQEGWFFWTSWPSNALPPLSSHLRPRLRRQLAALVGFRLWQYRQHGLPLSQLGLLGTGPSLPGLRGGRGASASS